VVRELATRAGLPAVPVPHDVPSAVVNAFATGSKNHSAIALTDGLLRSLTSRELIGVLGHEIAHIANEDLRVMGLADSISRLTHLLALVGQIAILFSVPMLLLGVVDISWPALLLLMIAPQLALFAQLGLSRVREFDADRLAAELTRDPHGLASALAKIERVSRSWRAWSLPGWGNPEPSWLRYVLTRQPPSALSDCGSWARRSRRHRSVPSIFCRNPPYRHVHHVGVPVASGVDFK
jgi:heat shock protein HtpX